MIYRIRLAYMNSHKLSIDQISLLTLASLLKVQTGFRHKNYFLCILRKLKVNEYTWLEFHQHCIK